MIHHHRRRAATGGNALFLRLQEDPAILGALAQLDAELVLDVLNDVVGAAQHAGHVGADRDFVAADRLRLEHRVKRRDLVDLDRRQIEVVGDRIHLLGGQVAVVLVLHSMQAH